MTKEWITGGLGDNTVNPMPMLNFGFWKAKGADPASDFSYNAGAIMMRDTDGYFILHDGSAVPAYVLKGDVSGKAGKKVGIGLVATGIVNMTAGGVVAEGDYLAISDAATGTLVATAPADITAYHDTVVGRALQDAAADGDRIMVFWSVM